MGARSIAFIYLSVPCIYKSIRLNCRMYFLATNGQPSWRESVVFCAGAPNYEFEISNLEKFCIFYIFEFQNYRKDNFC